MAEISKPTGLNIQWASAGDILDPGDTKYQTGWEVEIPPRQWENYIQNKQDKFIAHVNQHGVVVWDNETEYQTDESYVQGATNGLVYRCVLTHTNQDPELDVTNTYWEVAFAEANNTYTKTESDGLYLAKAQNLSDLVSTSTARTNLSVYSKSEANDLLGHGMVVFDTAGIAEWTVPADMQSGVIKPKVTVVAGGASGARRSAQSGGGGGGGGATVSVIDLTGITSVTVTVGAGGASPASDVAGNAGGSSSFGAYISATGGTAIASASFGGSAGGLGSGGTLNARGSGGGSAKAGVSAGNYVSGFGGGSIFSSGAPESHASVLTAGTAGFRGAGGSGGILNGTAGAGGPGVVLIEW